MGRRRNRGPGQRQSGRGAWHGHGASALRHQPQIAHKGPGALVAISRIARRCAGKHRIKTRGEGRIQV